MCVCVHMSSYSIPSLPLSVHTESGAILHACTVKDNAFVGFGATVLDGSVVGEGSYISAGSLVREGTQIPSGEVPLCYTQNICLSKPPF